MIYYYLHIFGTDYHDCKFIFSDKNKLLKFLKKLPLVKHTYEKRYLCPSEDQIYRYEQATIEGEEVLKYWESRISITNIDTNKLSRFHKYFPAPFWDELPDKHRERIYK